MKSTQLLQRLHVAILLCLNEVSFSLIPSTLTFTNYQRIPGSGFSHNRKEQHLFQSSWQSSNGNKNAKIRSRSKTTKLNGMNEWRDTYFDIPSLQAEEEGLLSGIDGNGIPREITVLPFPYEDVLLQGETKQLRLYEDRFIKLFEECMEKHSGVVAMGLIADSGIIQTVPVCEVEAYNRMEGFGIFVTIRVVGRAALIDLKQQEPYIKAVCVEVMDNVPPNLDIPNLIASNIENFMVSLSSLEHKIKTNMENEREEIDDKEMRRRIIDAQLDEKFYGDGSTIVNFEDEEEDDEEEEDDDSEEEDEYFEETPDRKSQFQTAFKEAKACDTQGYMISKSADDGQRSVQDLTALSWAVFCTDDVQDTVRVQALDSDDLFDRLKLGSYMLREKKAELEAKLALTDVKLTDEDDDDE